MNIGKMDGKDQSAVEFLFDWIGLPEVPQEDLEPGTYTNARIIEKVPDPITLTGLALYVFTTASKDSTPAQRRKLLCTEIDRRVAKSN